MTETVKKSSIDDLLAGEKTTTQPHTPESDALAIENVPLEEDILEKASLPVEPPQEDAPELEEAVSNEIDEYGNEVEPSKTYSEAEVNERINQAVRDRLARLERNQGQQQAAQQATKEGFQYNEQSNDSWEVQLEKFVEATVNKLGQKQAQQMRQEAEAKAQFEFEDKFKSGMSRFPDFIEVVGKQPFTDPMVIATRGMKDPSAFMYAASKQAAAEIQRISKIGDEYAQMVEMGKLEERLKKNKAASSAPKPVSRIKEDVAVAHKDDKTPSIEDLIARSDAKRKALMMQRRNLK